MKTSNAHHIKTLEYQITLDDKNEAHQLMAAISLLQESRVNPLLDSIMDKFSDENSIYQFNTVTLDLGTIRKPNYEQELLFRLEEKLTNYFKANISGDGTLRNGKRIVLNDHKLEQIEHFLLRGYLQWSASPAQSPSKLFNELMLENKKELVTLLNFLGKKEVVRKRMVRQFNEETLENLVMAVAENEGDYMISYKRNILEHQQKHRLADSSFSTFRAGVWEVILAYLLVDSNSYHHKKNFLQYLIDKIARKHNLTYQVLLETIAGGVRSERKSSYGHAFKKIVLELDNDQREIAWQCRSKRSVQKELVLDLIGQINYYLNFGTFSGKGQPESRVAFNHQFKLLLKKKRQATLQQLTNWLGSPSKRNSLLLLLNDEVLPQLAGYLNNPFVEESLAFIDGLERGRSSLSTSSKRLLQKIQQKKSAIVLNAFEDQPFSKGEIIRKFLKELWVEFHQHEPVLFQLFCDIKPQLPAEHRKALHRFLAKYEKKQGHANHPTVDEKKVGAIAKEIIGFTDANEIELWHYWINQKLPDWLKTTGLKKLELLVQIRMQLSGSSSSSQLVKCIEKVANNGIPAKTSFKKSLNTKQSSERLPWKNTSVNRLILEWVRKELEKIVLDNTLFSAWGKEVVQILLQANRQYKISIDTILDGLILYFEVDVSRRQIHDLLLQLKSSDLYAHFNEEVDLQKTEAFRKNMVHYVLNHGEIPWWGKRQYSWDDFNNDFATLWVSPRHKKQMLKLIQKNGQKIALYGFFNDNSLLQVCKALDKSPGKVHTNLINEIHQLLKNQLLPVGSIATHHYNEFVRQVFNLLLQRGKMQINTSLLNFIGKWAESSEITKGKSEKALLVSLLKKINRETTSISFKEQLTAWIDSWSGVEIRKDQPLNEVRNVRDLLTIYKLNRSQDGRHTPDLTVSLEQIIATAPKQFNDLLSREAFRDSLLNELSEKGIVKLISLKLNARQRQFLSASISILSLISSHISLQELKAVRKNYLKLTLLKLSAGGFASWQIANWGNLMFHCMTAEIGKHKSNAVLLKVNEKLLSKGKDEYRGEIELLDQIQRTATKTFNPAGTTAGRKEEEKAYRKLGEEAEKELLNPVFIKNAGLIILAPYLGMLFEKCGLIKNGEFNEEKSKAQAVHLLEYAAAGETGREEHELVINKLLCGMFINDPIERAIALHDQEKETVDSLLTAVTQQWPPLKNTSIDGLRTSFLQREGKLEEEEEQYYLKVEQKSFDMLLDQIPWNISKIKLSWMEKIIQVAWR